MPDGQEQQKEGEKEEKKEGGLESAVEEGIKFLEKLGRIGMAVAMPYTSAIFGPAAVAQAQLFAYPMAAGKATANVIQKKQALEGIAKESAVATTMAFPFSLVLSGANALERSVAAGYGTATAKVAKAIGWLGIGQPSVVALNTALNYGFGKKFREEYWERQKNVWKYLALPSTINLLFVAPYSIPLAMLVAGLNSFAFSFIQASFGKEGDIKNLFKAINPLPYAKATYTVVQKTAKGIYDVGSSVFKAVYEIGDSINKTHLKGGKPSPQQEPQPAPA